MTILTTAQVVGGEEYIDLEWTGLYQLLELRCFNAISDKSLIPTTGSSLTAYLGFGVPRVYHEGPSYPHYNSTGLTNFSCEPNELYKPPTPLYVPQNLRLGFRIAMDGDTRQGYGYSGRVEIACPGVVSGDPVIQQYWARGVRSHIGGVGGQSPKPSWWPHGGGYWFSGDPGTPFDHATPVQYGGHYIGAVGKVPTGLRLRMNGGGQDGAKFQSGLFVLEGFGTAVEYDPPEPEFTAIGDMNPGVPAQIDTSPQRPSTACAWKYQGADSSQDAWIGMAWNAPKSLSSLQVYSSQNDGFLRLPVGGSVRLQVFTSDYPPTNATDGVQRAEVTVTDSDGGIVSSFSNIPEAAYTWVRVSHQHAPTSVYVAALMWG